MKAEKFRKSIEFYRSILYSGVKVKCKDFPFKEFIIDKVETGDDKVWCHYHSIKPIETRICHPLQYMMNNYYILPEQLIPTAGTTNDFDQKYVNLGNEVVKSEKPAS